ncbi:membrane protein [Halodesulfovibrio spirochaetisodalis]|uniref:Membrane protein n=1 Tax=Halodesulfovibrio spirochaetisodalis TaxID=1560234 RepID=A0A1B7XN15_9BACT|nr:membrane protein [Halodesulfovibrio spirochaetisodalis]
MDVDMLWSGLFRPLLRLIISISLGLAIGNIIEALHWSRFLARISSPLVRMAHLQDVSGAAFTMAFFSSITANTYLAEQYEQGKIVRKELYFSNLLNSAPVLFLHLPSLFFLAVPFLGKAAFWYVGIIVSAALFRTLGTVVVGRMVLPPTPEGCVTCELDDSAPKSFAEAFQRVVSRFSRRIRRVLLITIPVYVLVFILNRSGFFTALNEVIGGSNGLLPFINPQAAGVLLLSLAAEITAAMAAAGALLTEGTIQSKDIVLALLAGNILSSPMRALRHQLATYMGIFPPRLALWLIFCNQSVRAVSLIVFTLLYYFWG